MPRAGRRSGRDRCRAAKIGWTTPLFVLMLSFLGASASAREVSLTGTPMKGFGRILLQFDEATKVRVRTTNSIVVVSFGERSRIKAERLVAELAPYVSTVRRDPDETGLRLALAVPVRTSVLEAGERVYIDLLPANWSGLPPGLPPEVVAELAERARSAEARLREEARRAPAPAPVTVRVAELPTLTRLVFEPPAGTPIRVGGGPNGIDLAFGGRLVLDAAASRPKLAAGVAGLAAVPGDRSLSVRVDAAPSYQAHAFLEDGTAVVDIGKPPVAGPPASPPILPPTAVPPSGPAPPRPSPSAAAAPGSATAAAQPAPDAAPDAPPSRQASAGAPGTPVLAVPGRPPSRRETVPTRREAPEGLPAASETVRAVLEPARDGVALRLPFARPTPAAALERAGTLILAFETSDRLDVSGLADLDPAVLRMDELRTERRLLLLRLTPAREGVSRLVEDGTAWRLTVGGRSGLPPDEARIERGTDADGHAQLAVALAGASAVHWIGDPESGAPLALVTAAGRPSQALSSTRRFVELDLPATLQGVAVARRAEDVTVGLGQGGVVIARKSGLSLSLAERDRDGGTARALLIDRETWAQDQSGDVLGRYRALVEKTADAPRGARAEARLRLARFLVAGGMAVEASGVLSLARQEDPVFARARTTVLLSGIAAALAGHGSDARGFLGSDQLAEDPEAALWRSVLDVRERAWERALSGFRRASGLIGRYPDELAATFRLATFRAAIEQGDTTAAEAALAALDRLPAFSVPRDEHDLARARWDEVCGRLEAALTSYDRLAEQAARPIAAQATLRGSALARRLGRSKPADIIPRLERLAASWRGDEIELGTLVELARLYADAGRWREMFATVRKADRLFPKDDLTRALHEEAGQRFETLLLGSGANGAAAKLPAAEVLAIYYDFREFAPIGRRGDEIVRRLADHLVELDLLDQAADLLQHQVDKRLTGVARASVAARLAAIRLMAGKPVPALAVLHATRLADLPADLRRLRLLLEAQAQADLTRTDLALEIVDGEDGEDFARLKASILFAAARWQGAGEAFEALLGTRWQGPDALPERDRQDILRAASADILAGEPIALARLRAKFGPKMTDSPDARTFELLMRPGVIDTREFRAIVETFAKADTLRQLLASWTAPRPPPERPAEEDAPAPVSPAPRVEARAG